MKIKTLLASIAAATFVMAQPLAAATRSADSIPSLGLQRVAAPVTNANYQDDDDDDDGGSTAVILGVVLIVLIGVAAISGGGGDSNN
jgi:hypothetical protein